MKNRLRGIALLLTGVCALTAVASAAPIQFTFKGAVASVSVNGAPAANVDLTVTLSADTGNLVRGAAYSNLTAFVSSTALRLSNAAATNSLTLDLCEHRGHPGN